MSNQFLMGLGGGGALPFEIPNPPFFAIYMFYWYNHRDSIFSTHRYSFLWEKNAKHTRQPYFGIKTNLLFPIFLERPIVDGPALSGDGGRDQCTDCPRVRTGNDSQRQERRRGTLP